MAIKKQLMLALAALFFLSGCANNDPVVGPYPKTGKASWYSAKITATGEKFSDTDLTCAMRKTDFGKYYNICNIANNKCVNICFDKRMLRLCPVLWIRQTINL